MRRVAAQLRAGHPQAAVRPLASGDDPLLPRRGERLWAATLELGAPSYVPLRLLADDADGPPPALGTDPLGALLGALGPLPDGWRAGTQLVARPLPGDHWGERVRRLALEPAPVRERERARDASAGGDLPSPTFLALAGLAIGGVALRIHLGAWLAAGAWGRVAAAAALLAALLVAAVALLARRARRATAHDHRLIAAKLAHPAYRVEVRLLVIAPPGAAPDAARERLADLVAAYGQFDAPGGNHFRPRHAAGGRPRDPRDLAPWGRADRAPVLCAQELAGLWHLPAGDADLPVARTGPRARLAPAAVVATGLRVGVSHAGGRAVPVHLPPVVAGGHQLLVARTQRGKSALLLRLAQGAMAGDGALLVLDPQGELARAALGLVPPARRARVVFVDLGDPDHAVGLNPLDVGLGWSAEGAVEHALALFRHHFPANWGPRMEDPFRMGLRTLHAANRARCAGAAGGDDGRDAQYTLYELGRLLLDDGFRKAVLAAANDPVAAQ